MNLTRVSTQIHIMMVWSNSGCLSLATEEHMVIAIIFGPMWQHVVFALDHVDVHRRDFLTTGKTLRDKHDVDPTGPSRSSIKFMVPAYCCNICLTVCTGSFSAGALCCGLSSFQALSWFCLIRVYQEEPSFLLVHQNLFQPLKQHRSLSALSCSCSSFRITLARHIVHYRL